MYAYDPFQFVSYIRKCYKKRGREKEQFHENHKADVFHSFMKKEIEVEIAITAISLSIVFKYYSSSSTFVL